MCSEETVDSKNMGVNATNEGFRMKLMKHMYVQFAGGTVSLEARLTILQNY